jgi:translation initiation factor 1 (eIF-1/SUI1)
MGLSLDLYIQVVVEEGCIKNIYRWSDDGQTQIECSHELSDEDYKHIVTNIILIEKSRMKNDLKRLAKNLKERLSRNGN